MAMMLADIHVVDSNEVSIVKAYMYSSVVVVAEICFAVVC